MESKLPLPAAPLFLWSDLHLETWGWKCHLRKDSTDLAHRRAKSVLLLPGDLSDGTSFEKAVNWLVGFAPNFLAVVLVLGNHEYHHPTTNPAGVLAAWEGKRAELLKSSVYLLNDEVLDLHGHRFIGSTMWTDPLLQGGPFNCRPSYVKNSVTDYVRVPGLTLEGVYEVHQRHLDFLERSLEEAETDSRQVVVVTHHCPSFACVDARFLSSRCNAAFAADLDERFLRRFRETIQVWVHGHTHRPVDREILGVRVVCHPRGRRDEGGTCDQPRELPAPDASVPC